MSNPLVSIIIPTLNRAHLIAETLDSVLGQTYPNWECIVVDDGSADNTDELMAEYMAKDSRFRYYHRPKNRLPGGNAARNYGFEMSKGEFVQWFDSDDIMLPEKLETQIYDLLNHKKQVHLCSGFKYDKRTYSFIELKVGLEETIFRQIALNSTEIMTPSLLIERTTYINTQVRFDENLSRGQETFFLINLSEKLDKKIIFQSNKRLFFYILHNEGSISKSDDIYDSRHVFSKAIVFSRIWSLNYIYNHVDIANRMYQKLISLLFSSLRNNDYDTSNSILKLIRLGLKSNRSKIYYKVVLYYLILKVFKFPRYRLMNSLLKIKIT